MPISILEKFRALITIQFHTKFCWLLSRCRLVRSDEEKIFHKIWRWTSFIELKVYSSALQLIRLSQIQQDSPSFNNFYNECVILILWPTSWNSFLSTEATTPSFRHETSVDNVWRTIYLSSLTRNIYSYTWFSLSPVVHIYIFHSPSSFSIRWPHSSSSFTSYRNSVIALTDLSDF